VHVQASLGRGQWGRKEEVYLRFLTLLDVERKQASGHGGERSRDLARGLDKLIGGERLVGDHYQQRRKKTRLRGKCGPFFFISKKANHKDVHPKIWHYKRGEVAYIGKKQARKTNHRLKKETGGGAGEAKETGGRQRREKDREGRLDKPSTWCSKSEGARGGGKETLMTTQSYTGACIARRENNFGERRPPQGNEVATTNLRRGKNEGGLKWERRLCLFSCHSTRPVKRLGKRHGRCEPFRYQGAPRHVHGGRRPSCSFYNQKKPGARRAPSL